MSLIEIAVPAGWFAGMVLAIRPMMRRTMLKTVCSECDGNWSCNCNNSGYRSSPERVVRGAKFEREGFHAANALWNAVWWPVWVPVVIGWVALCGLALAVKAVVSGMTPLTGPELERSINATKAEIERLTKEIQDPVVEGDVCHEDFPVVPVMSFVRDACIRCQHARDV